MGILLKNDEKNVSMGYITFGIIRQQIAKSYDYKIGELYSKLYNPLFKGYSNEENKYFNEKLPKYFDTFLFHSDVDGYFSESCVKGTYKELMKLKPIFTNDNIGKKYDDLLELFRQGERIYIY